MAYLSDKEWRALNQLVFRLYECASYENFSETLYKHLHPLLGFSKGLMYRIQEDGDSLRRLDPYTFSIPPEKPLDTVAVQQPHGSRTDEFLRAPWSSVFRESEMQDMQSAENIRRYKELWEPQNIHYGLHIALIYNDTPVGIVNFYRAKNGEDFSPRDIFIAETLMNHLALKLYLLRNAAVAPDRVDVGFAERGLFTNRELEVLRLLGDGISSGEICARLFISESTLRKHVYNIFRKTGVKSRPQLIVWIKNHGKA